MFKKNQPNRIIPLHSQHTNTARTYQESSHPYDPKTPIPRTTLIPKKLLNRKEKTQTTQKQSKPFALLTYKTDECISPARRGNLTEIENGPRAAERHCRFCNHGSRLLLARARSRRLHRFGDGAAANERPATYDLWLPRHTFHREKSRYVTRALRRTLFFLFSNSFCM